MRRAGALLLLVLIGSTAALPFASAATPRTVGPTLTAWYDATYPSATAPTPPAPPGVGATDLVVGGVSAGVGSVKEPTALTALAFTIPEGATAATLTLVLASAPSTAPLGAKLPTGVVPEACPVTATFVPGGRQSFDRVPAYDCTGRTSNGHLSSDGTSVVFSDIGAVARGKQLAFVVRPGTTGPERLVFKAPTSTSLSLLSFDSPPVFDPGGLLVAHPTPTPAAAPPTPAPSLAPSLAPVPVVAPTLPALGPGPSAVPSPTPVAEPALAPSPQPIALGAVAHAAVSDDTVRLEALAGLALLGVAFGLMVVTDSRRGPGGSRAEWGVGRFRAARDGRAPAL